MSLYFSPGSVKILIQGQAMKKSFDYDWLRHFITLRFFCPLNVKAEERQSITMLGFGFSGDSFVEFGKENAPFFRAENMWVAEIC